MYLNAAIWGMERLVSGRLHNAAFHFHLIGIHASLRAVQSVLVKHDCKLSQAHRMVIGAWGERTKDWRAIPELTFIKISRDLILKEGAFDPYATSTESGIGEFDNGVTRPVYDLAYYVDGVRRDLLADLRRAVDWCDRELTGLEDQLPAPE